MRVADYTDVSKNTVKKIEWGNTVTCDVDLWETADGCNGVATPWGFTTVVNYNSPTDGSVRAWHFLNDKFKDLLMITNS